MQLRQALFSAAFGIAGGIAGHLFMQAVGSASAPPGSNGAAQPVADEISVKRINIVEDDGRPAMVIANSRNLPASNVGVDGDPGIREGIPGMIFYNNMGDETGGLIYRARDVDGVGVDGGVQLSMDQIRQTGQAVALRHWRNGNYVRSMLQITDYSTEKFAGDAREDPEFRAVIERIRAAEEQEERDRIYLEEYLPLLGEKGYLAHRVFLGSEGAERRAAKLVLKDSRSRPRIRLIVDEQDQPRIEILDAEGVVQRQISTETITGQAREPDPALDAAQRNMVTTVSG